MFYDQSAFPLRFEWGEAAIRYLAQGCGAVVIVDVLSFGTAVDVALGRGATVLPYRWKDGSAASFAEAQDALLARSDRGFTGGQSGRWSLSPASLATLPEGARLVLPSPNGSALSVLAAASGAAVYSACLRNAGAVAAHVGERYGTVLVVAAGERWPDGSLRPAAEDLWGAGAVIASLGLPASPEAEVAVQAFQAVQHELAATMRACSSGRELIERGFGADLEWAAAYGVSRVVPVLRDGAYRNAAAEP